MDWNGFWIQLFFLQGCVAVRLLEDSVIPPHALRGQQTRLRCNYDLENDNLYSVKWYFNDQEFYRYIPSDSPKVTIFHHLPGIRVDRSLSSEKEIVLDNVDFDASGKYSCEVSADAPMFQTASTSGILYVVDLPESGPDIEGGQPRYRIGDWVNVSCTSRNSLPAAQLAWYINGEKADKQYLTSYPEEEHHNSLRSSKLGLMFKVHQKHFKHNDLKLKCTATISTVYWKSNEESVQGSGLSAHSSPVSESRGRTSVVLQFLFAAATSHISGTGSRLSVNISPLGFSALLLLLFHHRQIRL
ncbi:uncharacterized protein [Lepeophtheirus salmonis]|uniref:uncharacterized protein isoform X1 n=1 Tax=Lepeophtheirus salmonis TaxID=72036 RepID=UPI003AF38490